MLTVRLAGLFRWLWMPMKAGDRKNGKQGNGRDK